MVLAAHCSMFGKDCVTPQLYVKELFLKNTLSKSHDEDEIDDDEAQQVGSRHSVNHDYGRTGQFETSEK